MRQSKKASANEVRQAKKLDKWYTRPELATAVWRLAEKHIPKAMLRSCGFVEPSAGSGVFIETAPAKWKKRLKAFDLKPEPSSGLGVTIHKKDFLEERTRLTGKIVIGNPPFGKKARLAMDFIRRSFDQGAVAVVFILPVCARRPQALENIPEGVRCVADCDVPAHSYFLCGKKVAVKTCVQVWIRRECAGRRPSLEMRRSGADEHKDFEIAAWKKGQSPVPHFDFAVPAKACDMRPARLGFEIENRRPESWHLIRVKEKGAVMKVGRKLEAIDWSGVAYHASTACPGVSRADIVRAYEHGFRRRPMLRIAA